MRSKGRQVAVAGDDALGLGAFGAFEDRFILGIAADARNGPIQIHVQVQPENSQVGANPLRFLAELAGQHPHNLFLDLVAHGEPILGDGSDHCF